MGFLSAWDATERIDVSDLAGELPGTWWIDVKKCLSHDEADRIMRGVVRDSMDFRNTSDDGKPTVKMSGDVVMNQQARIVATSIAGWNLTDDQDNPLPTTPFEALEHSLSLLPSPVYDRVAKVVVAANTETKEETASFPTPSNGGDASGEDYRPNDREILV
jgi:hypothetical protein